ncbi:alpha/beta fold hydrolase [Micromonospora haikouensis]|uniref:alpha/beta fold hydrolase n=1 Tax=Micromonospora haikouensis TaxID=686309 RepID=UPI00210CCC33|nr:alpha/beta hydrolase [Micromonospora haikouensis]
MRRLRLALAAPRPAAGLTSEWRRRGSPRTGCRRRACSGTRSARRWPPRWPPGTPRLVRALVLAGPTSDPAARTRRGQFGRWLVDTLREAPWQAPILLRDVVDARPWRVYATLSHSVRNAIEADAARVTAPTLVVTGARDPVVPAAWRDRLARLAPDARAAAVPGAAHNVATTAPVEVAAAVRALLASSLRKVA